MPDGPASPTCCPGSPPTSWASSSTSSSSRPRSRASSMGSTPSTSRGWRRARSRPTRSWDARATRGKRAACAAISLAAAPGPRRLVRLAAALLAALSVGCRSQGPGPPPVRELRILLPADLLSTDPNRDIETTTEAVLFNVYEPLVGFDARLGVRPMLAESWEHPAPERWRFHLRRGVRFHDGAPLTAEFARDALLQLRDSKDREAAAMLAVVEEISVVDDFTLDLVTSAPRAILANLPPVYIARPAEPGSFPPWVGTGPFRIEEWRMGERIVLRRVADYWGATAHHERVVFEPLPTARARLERLRAGDADLIYDVPPEAVSGPCQGCRFVHHDGATLYYLAPNVRQRPWSDVRVRRAVDLAIDRDG